MSFTGTGQINIRAKIDSAHGLVTPEADMTRKISSAFASDNTYFTADTDITTPGNAYDLSGSLEDDLGDTVIFKEIHLLHFKNDSTVASANNMIIGSATTHIPIFKNSAHAMTIKPQSSFTLMDDTGIPVTAGTADTLNIWGANGQAYELVIIGRRVG